MYQDAAPGQSSRQEVVERVQKSQETRQELNEERISRKVEEIHREREFPHAEAGRPERSNGCELRQSNADPCDHQDERPDEETPRR